MPIWIMTVVLVHVIAQREWLSNGFVLLSLAMDITALGAMGINPSVAKNTSSQTFIR